MAPWFGTSSLAVVVVLRVERSTLNSSVANESLGRYVSFVTLKLAILTEPGKINWRATNYTELIFERKLYWWTPKACFLIQREQHDMQDKLSLRLQKNVKQINRVRSANGK